MSLTCPSNMSPLRIPGSLSSVLLVRRIDKLWALRFCLGWRPAKAEPLLLPPSPGIPPTSCVALPTDNLEESGKQRPAVCWSAVTTCEQVKGESKVLVRKSLLELFKGEAMPWHKILPT